MRDSALICKFNIMKINVIIMLFITATAIAQTEKATISVRGNCGMCKARIEKAAIKTQGVKYAVWQAETEQLILLFNPKKNIFKSSSKKHCCGGTRGQWYCRYGRSLWCFAYVLSIC